MANSNRWYCTREDVKAALPVQGQDYDALIDRFIDSASAGLERILLNRRFIPYLGTNIYEPIRQGRVLRPDWAESENPWRYGGLSRVLRIDDLLTLTSITLDLDRDGSFSDETALTSNDYELTPRNAPHEGLPYTAFELTIYGSQWYFPPNSRVQVVGLWGYCNDTRPAGTLVGDITDSATTLIISSAALVGIGNTLKIGSEALFVSSRDQVDTTATLTAGVAADSTVATIPVDAGSKLHVGEVILVGAERMLITAISGNNAIVKRDYFGSNLEAHLLAEKVYAERQLTVVRGLNGTTATAHLSTVAIDAYVPPGDIQKYCIAQAAYDLQQGQTGWTSVGGGGDNTQRLSSSAIRQLSDDITAKYGKVGL